MTIPEDSQAGKRPRTAKATARRLRRARRRTARASKQPRAARSRASAFVEGDLVLSESAEPKTVYVQRQLDGTPGFATDKNGDYFSDLEWNPLKDQTHDLFINFVLLDGVDRIVRLQDHQLYCSSPFDGGGMQLLAAPAIAGTYTFSVFMTDKSSHDPKIVITPQ